MESNGAPDVDGVHSPRPGICQVAPCLQFIAVVVLEVLPFQSAPHQLHPIHFSQALLIHLPQLLLLCPTQACSLQLSQMLLLYQIQALSLECFQRLLPLTTVVLSLVVLSMGPPTMENLYMTIKISILKSNNFSLATSLANNVVLCRYICMTMFFLLLTFNIQLLICSM